MVKPTRRALLALPLMAAAPATAWDFRFPALEGGEYALGAWRGRVLLVVNTASFCGFTQQYAALQRLHETQEAAGLVVLGVPSNDFNQESQDGRKIREFCDAQFGITFPMAALCRVRGPEAHPFYRWAAAWAAGEPRWNFHKYLVSRDGRQVLGFPARVDPDSPTLKRALEQALAAAPPIS
jgi:glutathione peroxidase